MKKLQRILLSLAIVLLAGCSLVPASRTDSELGFDTPTSEAEPTTSGQMDAGASELPKPEVPEQIETTDSRGLVTFEEAASNEPVEVYIRSEEDGEAVEDIKVMYQDGDGYEFFLAVDPSNAYLPAVGLYPHNSKHIIEMERREDGSEYAVILQSTLGDETLTQRWINDQGIITYQHYHRTISAEEYDRIYAEPSEVAGELAGDVIIHIIADLMGAVAPVTGAPRQVDPTRPLMDYYLKMWDYGAGTTASVRIYLESNDPWVDIQDVSVDNGIVTASWVGHDAEMYADGTPDLTRYLGKTRESDLTYHVRVYNAAGNRAVTNWADINGTTWQYGGLEPGDYQLWVMASDERELSRGARFAHEGNWTLCDMVLFAITEKSGDDGEIREASVATLGPGDILFRGTVTDGSSTGSDALLHDIEVLGVGAEVPHGPENAPRKVSLLDRSGGNCSDRIPDSIQAGAIMEVFGEFSFERSHGDSIEVIVSCETSTHYVNETISVAETAGEPEPMAEEADTESITARKPRDTVRDYFEAFNGKNVDALIELRVVSDMTPRELTNLREQLETYLGNDEVKSDGYQWLDTRYEGEISEIAYVTFKVRFCTNGPCAVDNQLEVHLWRLIRDVDRWIIEDFQPGVFAGPAPQPQLLAPDNEAEFTWDDRVGFSWSRIAVSEDQPTTSYADAWLQYGGEHSGRYHLYVFYAGEDDSTWTEVEGSPFLTDETSMDLGFDNSETDHLPPMGWFGQYTWCVQYVNLQFQEPVPECVQWRTFTGKLPPPS